MHKKYDLVATIGKYKNRDGEEKKRYMNVGAIFEGDDGRLAVKLDALPLAADWSRWLACYEPRQFNDSPPPPRTTHETAKANAYQPEPESEDDIPF